MADEYKKVKRGKLKLKGVKNFGPPGTSSSQKDEMKAAKRLKREHNEETSAVDQDISEHGGWRLLSNETSLKDVIGHEIAIEVEPYTYVAALDTGRFITGAPHPSGEGPDPEETLTVIQPPDANWFALKTGYGKYVSVDPTGLLIANSDAVGSKERWEVVFEDGRTALLAYNSCFLSNKADEEGFVYALSTKARESEMITLRTNAERQKPEDYTPAEDKKGIADCELSYIKMYQHSKTPINHESRSEVRKAKGEGNLHTVLLDRRTKMKADRYCK